MTHDTDLASKCDIQIFIRDGKIENMTGNIESPQAESAEPAESLSEPTSSTEEAQL